mmetsp:Transcript_17634/g.37752  ORF Transcript_17634/g.37752 Transcript_17634/m.37752 type:complete len:249 (-) Transcript_17634:1408-2154(-)
MSRQIAHPFGGILVCKPNADQSEPRIDGNFVGWVLCDLTAKEIGLIKSSAQEGFDAIGSEIFDHHPDPQGPKAAAEGDGPIFELRRVDVVVSGSHEDICCGVHVCQKPPVSHPQEARVESAEEPLGSADVHRSGNTADGLRILLEFRQHPSWASICSINMNPQVLLSGDAFEVGRPIKTASICCSVGEKQHGRHQSIGLVFLDCRLHVFSRKSVVAIDLTGLDDSGSHAGHTAGLWATKMRLVREVDN